MDHRPTGRRAAALLAAGLAGAGALGACGGGSHSSAALLGTAKDRQCINVTNVLSDGPDPTADPVGYAEAQPRDLDELTFSDKALGTAVHRLADAYEAYFDVSQKTTASAASIADKAKVAAAAKQVDAICPGATQ